MISMIAALSVAAFIVGFVALNDPGAVFDVQAGPGAFYRLMPHNAMALLFAAALLYAIVAMTMGLVAFWRDIKEPIRSTRGAEVTLAGDQGCRKFALPRRR